MKNLVVTGFTKTNPTTCHAYIAEWNLPNIQKYAKKCDADFYVMNCNKNNDKLDILNFLSEYDNVCWIDIDLVMRVEYMINVLQYNDNVSFLHADDKYKEFKLPYLKQLTSDPIILNGNKEMGSAILSINKSLLEFIDDDFKLLLKNRPVFYDEPYWTILMRRSNSFISLNDLDKMCCKFLDKTYTGLSNFSAYSCMHFVNPYFKRFKSQEKTRYVCSHLMFEISEAFKNQDDESISKYLDEWKLLGL